MKQPTQLDRRDFLSKTQKAGLGFAATAVFTSTAPARTVSPNDKITMAMVGIRGRGALHSTGFAHRL